MTPLTDRAQELADDERALLGDLLAVIEEHSVEGSREDRRRGDRARVHVRLRAPRGSAAAHRRGLHHPPGGGGEDLRRAPPRHRDPLRGAAPRHRGGHQRQPGSGRGAVRRLGRPARRRGHQAHRDHVPEPRREPGRELPEDDGRDGHGSPGHPDQARRPPPQHAHPVGAAEAEADREGPRDARDLRSARSPAGDPRDQVGARGPLLPAPAPAEVRGDQEARLPAARRARALRHRRGQVPEAASWRRSASRPRSQAARSTSTRSTRR